MASSSADSLEVGKKKHPDKSYPYFYCFFFHIQVKRRGKHTHLRTEDTCCFCNTTVLKSTHIDCTIYSSLYSEIQQGLNFTPCSGKALLA